MKQFNIISRMKVQTFLFSHKSVSLARAVGYHVLVPWRRNRNGSAKQCVNETDEKVPYVELKCNMRQSTPFSKVVSGTIVHFMIPARKLVNQHSLMRWKG